MGARTIAVLGALALVAAAGCTPQSATAAGAADPRAAGSLLRGDFTRELLLTGELEAVRSVSIKAPETSLFQMRIQFMAEEGTVVKPGDPLLGFDNSSLAAQVRDLETQILDAQTQIVAKRAELASALKDLEILVAEREYEHARSRLEASVDPVVLSEKEHAERQLAFTKAERELEEIHERIELTRSRGQAEVDVLVINRDKLRQDLLSAEQSLDRLSIEAPAEGLVVYESRQDATLRYQEGDSCWPGQGVIRLPDLSEMRVRFDVNEVDAPLLEVGMRIVVTLDAFPGRELQGEIQAIPSMAVKRDEESKIAVFKVRASLAETWVDEMKPGMSVLGRIVVDERRDVPLVPRSAVTFDGAGYRLRGEPLEPLARNGTHYVLSEDDYRRFMAKERT